jgi:hypothetical protein
MLTPAPRTMKREVPAGTVNGSNVTFTVSRISSFLALFNNGILLTSGNDYTLAGLTITFLTGAIPQSGDTLSALLS